MHGRKGVVAQDRLPGLAVFPGLRQIEPGLHVFAGRAGVVARRQEVDIKRAAASRTGPAPFSCSRSMTGVKSECERCHVRSRSSAKTRAWPASQAYAERGRCLSQERRQNERQNDRADPSEVGLVEGPEISVLPPKNCIRAMPKTGASKALKLNTRKLIAPGALPLTLCGLASLTMA